MKIIHRDFGNGEIKIEVEDVKDLWYLNNTLDAGDLLQGRAERKIKVGEAEKGAVVKKPIFITIRVEKIDFHRYSDVLRVNGTVVEGPEDVPKGAHQTIEIEPESVVRIKKEEWYDYQKRNIEEASKETSFNILILAFDRESAIFALLKKYGYEVLLTMEGEVEKKAFKTKNESTFFQDIVKQIAEYDKRYKLIKIIVASPAFWKEDLLRMIDDDELGSKITTTTCGSVGTNAIEEIIKRDEIKNILKEERVAKEMNAVEELLRELSKDGLAVYGVEKVEDASAANNVSILLITDSFILKSRERDTFKRIDAVMKAVDKKKGDIKIISSEHEGGKKLNGLGGIAAILRYKSY